MTKISQELLRRLNDKTTQVMEMNLDYPNESGMAVQVDDDRRVEVSKEVTIDITVYLSGSILSVVIRNVRVLVTRNQMNTFILG